MDNALSGQPSRYRTRLAFLFACACVSVVLLFSYKLVPGAQPSTHVFLIDAAYAECLGHSLSAGDWGCTNFGYPSGAIKPFGLPVSLVAMALFGWDGQVSLGEMQATYATFLLAAFALCYVFFHRISGTRLVGILGAALYLLSPIVVEQSGYGSLQLGFALIPGYFVLDSMILSVFRTGNVRRILAALVVAALSRMFALYLDGYSFVFSSMLALAYFAVSTLPKGRRAHALFSILGYLAACAVAVVFYRGYVEENALAVMPIDFFRGAGVDVATMISPLRSQWPYSTLGIGLDVVPSMVYGAYDDRSGLTGTFIGYAYFAASLAALWLWLRGRLRGGPLVAALVLCALVAFELSLGPSLKLFDFRESTEDILPGSFELYLMDAKDATLDLHTTWIYEHIPGIRNIRSLARWLVLVRLAFVCVLVLLVGHLFRSGHGKWAVALAALALFETSPDPAKTLRTGGENAAYATEIYDHYPRWLSTAVKPGERVFLLQLHDGAGDNEFASDFICIRTRIHCYNAGGDKTSSMAQSWWPREIVEAKWRHDLAGNLHDAFANGSLDAVVVPHFDLRGVVVSREAGAVPASEVRKRALTLAEQSHSRLLTGDYFSVLRPQRVAKNTSSPSIAECGTACWRAWPLRTQAKKIEWGPRVAAPGELFNAQPSGYSAIWVALPDPDQRFSIAFGDLMVATNSNETMIVGLVPAEVSAGLKMNTRHPVYLVDRKERTRYQLGSIDVR